jgi:hypothetical protein
MAARGSSVLRSCSVRDSRHVFGDAPDPPPPRPYEMTDRRRPGWPPHRHLRGRFRRLADWRHKQSRPHPHHPLTSAPVECPKFAPRAPPATRRSWHHLSPAPPASYKRHLRQILTRAKGLQRPDTSALLNFLIILTIAALTSQPLPSAPTISFHAEPPHHDLTPRPPVSYIRPPIPYSDSAGCLQRLRHSLTTVLVSRCRGWRFPP